MNLKQVSQETKLLIKNIALSIGIKGGALIISLISTPLYLRYFEDNVVLGLWFTLYSMLSWILNFDLGIGNGLRNKLTISLAKQDDIESRNLIYTAYTVSFIFVVTVFVLYFSVRGIVDWGKILNIPVNYSNMKEILTTIDIVVVSILLQILLRTINYIYYAEQLPNINNIIALISSLLMIFSIYILIILKLKGKIVYIAWLNLLAVNIPLFLVTILYFFRHPYLRSTPINITKNTIKNILDLGLKFFYVQIAYMIVVSTNEFFVNFYCGSTAVVEYSIYNRLFTIIGIVIGVLSIPVWSAITKAVAEQNFRWMKKIFKLLFLIGVFSVTVNLLLALGSQQIFNIWLHNDSIEVMPGYVWIFALYGAAISMVGVLTTFANGMGEIRLQALFYTIISVAKVILANKLSERFGWIGVILISTVGLWIFNIVQYYDISKRIQAY